MVVIAIISIIAAVAVPAIKSYVLRSEVVAAINYIKPLQDATAAYYNIHGSFPTQPTQFPDINFDSTFNSYTSYNDGGIIYVTSNTINSIEWDGYYCDAPTANATFTVIHFNSNIGFDSILGTSAGLFFVQYPDAAGNIVMACGQWDPGTTWQTIPQSLWPSECTQQDICHTFH